MVGVTNKSLELKDNKGGRGVNEKKSQELWEALDTFNFIDMGFSGLIYSWTNCREGGAKIQEHIDKAWCSFMAHQGS